MKEVIDINKLYNKDNLELMKELESDSIQLIYSDILYATGRDFKDYQDLPYNKLDVFEFYLPRIEQMYRILKDSGTLALQMDFRISHWLREICDVYFGHKNCVNVIEWAYSSGGGSKKKLSQKNDTIIIYAKDIKKQKFNLMQETSYNRDFKPYRFKGVEEFQDEQGRWYTMVGMKAVWTDIPMVGRTSGERVGYATQKPLKLMNRIRDLYTDVGDLIADFFMGSGSMIESAAIGNRNYIGCDINPDSIKITEERLEKIN